MVLLGTNGFDHAGVRVGDTDNRAERTTAAYLTYGQTHAHRRQVHPYPGMLAFANSRSLSGDDALFGARHVAIILLRRGRSIVTAHQATEQAIDPASVADDLLHAVSSDSGDD